jgi:hypothetical protein
MAVEGDMARLGEALVRHGWTVQREVETLVALARHDDAEVSMRAIDTLRAVVAQVALGVEMRGPGFSTLSALQRK